MRFRAIKVYGERNTGTHYLSALLAQNVDLPHLRGQLPGQLRVPAGTEWGEVIRDAFFVLTRRHNLGWKHRIAPTPDELARWRSDGVLFVTIAKNPYAWILSLHRRPYRYPSRSEDLLEFIESPWPNSRRGGSRGPWPSPVDLWNRKNASYLRLPEHAPASVVRYEDLLSDPRAVIVAMAARFDLPRTGPFRNVEQSTKADPQSFADYRRYYLDERWREKLRPEHIAAINQRLDPAVMHALGYARIEATEAA